MSDSKPEAPARREAVRALSEAISVYGQCRLCSHDYGQHTAECEFSVVVAQFEADLARERTRTWDVGQKHRARLRRYRALVQRQFARERERADLWRQQAHKEHKKSLYVESTSA